MGYKADHEDFVDPAACADGRADGQIAAWTWKQTPTQDCPACPARRANGNSPGTGPYQAAVAGRCIGDTFRQAAGRLTETAGISQGHGPVTAGTPYA
jgi:hypothetical protein